MSAKVAKNAKPKGKTSAYAYFTQAYREENKGKNIPFGELSKQCGDKWKTMSDKAKQRFNELAERDKTRFEKEMKSYVPPPKEEEEEKGGKKRKRVKPAKDPNAPKRPMSAYFLYLNDSREGLKKERGDMKITEVTKVLGARWNKETPAIRKKYEDKAKVLKENYEKEIAKYNKNKAPSSPEEEDEEEEEDSDE